jgi:DNA-binding NtrC family response regulator
MNVGEILLIAADWQFRALVRAQLLEEGYTVRAFPLLESALAYLMRSSERPQSIIVDVQDARALTRILRDLWRLSGEVPLILCGGAASRELANQEDLPPARLLYRPFRIKDVVDEVRRAWACPEGESLAG